MRGEVGNMVRETLGPSTVRTRGDVGVKAQAGQVFRGESMTALFDP